MFRPLIRLLCLPDIDQPIGGVKQLYRHVEHLCRLGYDAAVLTSSESFRPSWFISDAPSSSLSAAYQLGQLSPQSTILVVPETYVNVDFSDFYGFNLSNFARVVFNQNAYYSFANSSEPSRIASFYNSSNVIHVLSISEDTHDFLSFNLSVPDHRLSRIINAIETSFVPQFPKNDILHWMPRKNPSHVFSIITSMQLSSLANSKGWHGEPLVDLPHVEVANKLNSAKIFLSFGHPEGFGLPVAEAMASGCWVIGYSGGGAKELFRFGASHEIPFGDWHLFNKAISEVFDLFAQSPREVSLRLQRQSLAVRSLYNFDAEHQSIDTAWKAIVSAFDLWKNQS